MAAEHNRQEPLMGQSVPASIGGLLAAYLLLTAAVVITSVLFFQRGVLDVLQILLTVATLGCCIGGIAHLLMTRNQQVLLYDTYFTVGDQSFAYKDVMQVENHQSRVQFTTGKGKRHSFRAGNAEALVYLIERKRKETKGTGKKKSR